MKWKIEGATKSDFDWITKLFKKNEGILGSADLTIWRHKNSNAKSRFIVIRPHAFAHFNLKRNGEKTLYEIAVDTNMKRMGIGRALVDFIGAPMLLKTDADNIASNAFYASLGFFLLGEKFTKSGKRVNVWKKFF